MNFRILVVNPEISNRIATTEYPKANTYNLIPIPMSLSIIGTIILTSIVVIYILISWRIRMKARRSAQNKEENRDDISC